MLGVSPQPRAKGSFALRKGRKRSVVGVRLTGRGLPDYYSRPRRLPGQKAVNPRRILRRTTLHDQVDIRIQRFQPLHVALVVDSPRPVVTVSRCTVCRSQMEMSLLCPLPIRSPSVSNISSIAAPVS